MNILGKRIRELRESKDMTQEMLARNLGLTHATVGHYEKGVRKPDTEILVRLAKSFNVSTDYLLGLTDMPTPYVDRLNNENMTIAAHSDSDYNQELPEEAKEAIKVIIESYRLKELMKKKESPIE